MQKEFITIKEKETAIRIQNTKVDALRTKDIVKKGVRVYQDDRIGISGAIGDISRDALVNNAIKNLKAGISYPYDLSKGIKDHRDYSKKKIEDTELMDLSEGILEKLRIKYRDFDFSESISTKELTWKMENTEGLDLEYRDEYMTLGLILKEKKSANLFDGFLQYAGRSFDLDKFWAFNEELLEAYGNEVALPEGEVLPVFSFELSELQNFLSRSLNGEVYATGGSIFSNKIGDKLFNERITIAQDMNPRHNPAPFFDMEGVVAKNDCYNLIKKGQLTGVYTDKRAADIYNLPHTGAASGGYDGMPEIFRAPLRFAIDSEDIKAALDGRMAILAMVSSGGDFTSDGNFAAPVQAGFLFDGHRIIGKLPEFTMRSHLYKMLGEDYIGTFKNKHLYIGEELLLQGYNMTIVP